MPWHMICKNVFIGTTEMASHIPSILRALSRACTRATRGFQKIREGSMHKRKRSRMAFRPCLSQAFLEDRLVLNSGAVGVSSPIQAIATHAAMIGAAAIPAALVSPSTASSAVSSAKQTPVAASPSQSSLAISNSNQFTGSTGTGSTGAGSAGTGSTGVESTDPGIATTIVGSTPALPTPFDNSLQNSTSNVENLYDIPATDSHQSADWPAPWDCGHAQQRNWLLGIH